jgi:Putative cyclase
VLDAAKWIKEGKIYKLGHNYESTMPFFGKRVLTLRIPGSPTGGPFGDNRLVYHDEFVSTEIGQVGTQFDGLGHIGVQLGGEGDKREMRFYNGHAAADFSDAYGLKKLGVENCKPFFTRGHLIDMVAVKGRMMEAGEEISVADIRTALQKQNMSEADFKRHLFQYRLEFALGQEQRQVQQRRAWHRSRGRELGDRERSQPHRR